MNKISIKKKIKTGIRKLIINKNGQATVEFILLIPFFIIIFLAVSQLGYVVYLQNNIKQLSREAARIISTTNSNNSGIQLINQNQISGNKLDCSIAINPDQKAQRKVGDMVKVGISLNYDGFGGLIKKLFGKTLQIYSESSMRMECE